MKITRLLLLMPFAATAWAGNAQACYDGRNMQAYFSYQPPTRSGATVMLRVRIDNVGDGVVHAQLEGSFAALSPDGTVRILLPEHPFGSNCLVMGPTNGPVFVIGELRQTDSGRLSLVATPTRVLPRRRMHSRCEIEQYIVDPAYLPPRSRRCVRGAR